MVKSTLLVMMLSIYTMNMFSMHLDLDKAHHYQQMTEHQTDSNENFAEGHNEEHDDVNREEKEDGDGQSVVPEEEITQQPFLMGWDWLHLSEGK